METNLFDIIGICTMLVVFLTLGLVYLFYCYPKELERRKQRDSEYNQWREKIYQVLSAISIDTHDIRVDVDAIDHNVANISYKYSEPKE